MQSADGKFYKTDVADVEQLFRLIQSVPSPKAEPFKLWLAQLGRERLEEIDDPEMGIERIMEFYHRKGYSESWINQRLKSIEVRKELTDEWEQRGVKKGQEYATLTDIITMGWGGHDDQAIQTVQGTENRKPARQHDQSGIGVEYAGRGFDDRDFQAEEAPHHRPKPERCRRGRIGRRRCTQNPRSENREARRVAAQRQSD